MCCSLVLRFHLKLSSREVAFSCVLLVGWEAGDQTGWGEKLNTRESVKWWVDISGSPDWTPLKLKSQVSECGLVWAEHNWQCSDGESQLVPSRPPGAASNKANMGGIRRVLLFSYCGCGGDVGWGVMFLVSEVRGWCGRIFWLSCCWANPNLLTTTPSRSRWQVADTKTKQCGLAHKREVRGEEEQLQL